VAATSLERRHFVERRKFDEMTSPMGVGSPDNLSKIVVKIQIIN
jgi:hypothetical protein